MFFLVETEERSSPLGQTLAVQQTGFFRSFSVKKWQDPQGERAKTTGGAGAKNPQNLKNKKNSCSPFGRWEIVRKKTQTQMFDPFYLSREEQSDKKTNFDSHFFSFCICFFFCRWLLVKMAIQKTKIRCGRFLGWGKKKKMIWQKKK